MEIKPLQSNDERNDCKRVSAKLSKEELKNWNEKSTGLMEQPVGLQQTVLSKKISEELKSLNKAPSTISELSKIDSDLPGYNLLSEYSFNNATKLLSSLPVLKRRSQIGSIPKDKKLNEPNEILNKRRSFLQDLKEKRLSFKASSKWEISDTDLFSLSDGESKI